MAVILCIDFEATCFENCSVPDMEIIEIGVIAVDDSGQEVGRFHGLIKPFFTEVTDFSFQINHISPSEAERFVYFPETFKRLKTWLDALPEEPSIWYSWGTYDQRQWQHDLQRYGFDDPLPKHINAKRLFQKKVIPGKRQVGLRKALEIVGLEFEGRQHCAIDDAQNLMQLCSLTLLSRFDGT